MKKKTVKKPNTFDKLVKEIENSNLKVTKLKDVLTTIEKWANDNAVSFVGSFVSFDNDCEPDEVEVIAFGHEDEIKIQLEALSEIPEEADEDGFINL